MNVNVNIMWPLDPAVMFSLQWCWNIKEPLRKTYITWHAIKAKEVFCYACTLLSPSWKWYWFWITYSFACGSRFHSKRNTTSFIWAEPQKRRQMMKPETHQTLISLNDQNIKCACRLTTLCFIFKHTTNISIHSESGAWLVMLCSLDNKVWKLLPLVKTQAFMASETWWDSIMKINSSEGFCWINFLDRSDRSDLLCYTLI